MHEEFIHDSKSETHFQWWLEELQLAGYVNGFSFHPFTFTLAEPVKCGYIKHLKTKDQIIEMELLTGATYTPDFSIAWNPRASGIFYKPFPIMDESQRKAPIFANRIIPKDIAPTANTNTELILFSSLVDVKGKVSIRVAKSYTTLATFPFNQKWVYQTHKLFVAKVEVPTIFEKTFTPQRYLLCDIQDKPRTLSFTPRTLQQFLQLYGR